MILFQKLHDIKVAAEKLVSSDELVVALFRDLPELQHFSFSKIQEYDDNNYFTDVHVTEINGHPYGYDGYEDEDEESQLPKINQEDARLVENLVQMISDGYDLSGDDYRIYREDYKDAPKRKKGRDAAPLTYLHSYLSGKKLSNTFFITNDPKWAIYYAMDNGRFDGKTEFRIFSKKGRMWDALQYAQEVIKGRLPSEIENFYILENHEDDRENLKKYLEWVNGQETEKPVEVLPEVHQGTIAG
jgi:hypothetical protein